MIDKQIQDNYDKLIKTGLQIILMNYLQFLFYAKNEKGRGEKT